MKFLAKLPLLALLALLSFSCTTDSLEDETAAIELNLITPETKPIEVQILELINNHRTSLGLNALADLTIVKSVVNAWLKSEAHRANIEGDFTNFDVSAEENAEGKWYYTNIFIKK